MNNNFPCAKNEYCKKQYFSSLSKISAPPFETGDSVLDKLFRYFLHRAPDISSAHSFIIPDDKHKDIYEKMFENRYFTARDVCSSNCKIEKHMSDAGLYGKNICLKCSRFVCKKKKTTNEQPESDLDCLLRHIRNAIAHGNTYYLHTENRIFLVLDDFSDRKQTARIVCLRADIEHWYKVLSDKTYI